MNELDPMTLVMWAFSNLKKENENIKNLLTETKLFSEMKGNLLEKRNQNLLLKIKSLEEEIQSLQRIIQDKDDEYCYDKNNQETFFQTNYMNTEKMDIDTEMDFFSDSDDN